MTLNNLSTIQIVHQQRISTVEQLYWQKNALPGGYGTIQKDPHQTMQSSRQVKVESQQDSTFELGHGPCQQDSGESIQNRQNGSQLVGQYRILQPGTPIRYCRQAKSCVQHQARPHYLSKAVAAILDSNSLALFMTSGNRSKPNFRKQYMIRMLQLIISKILAFSLFSRIFKINTIMQLYYLYLKIFQLIFAVYQFSQCLYKHI
uniref:Transmembrane domain-containing protein n=1 Tax=Spironucleus salmonicida TaxID=348837 RepID=V6LLM5_9EUKA|eukprot:EST41609.1 Transmembrane domain-containing protein [Spironucleus salmonicida]